MNVVRMKVSGIVLESGRVRFGGSIQDPVDLGLELGRVEEKTGEEKTWLQPVDFWFLFFLLKRFRFDFKKIYPVKTRNSNLKLD